MPALQLAARLYIGALVATALVAAGLLLAWDASVTPAKSGLAVILVAAIAIADLFPVDFAFKRKLQLDTPAVVVAFLLFPPGIAMTITGAGVLVAATLQREHRDWPQAAFNSAQMALQTLIGSATVTAFGWDPTDPTFDRPLILLGIVLAGATTYLFNVLAVGIIVALQMEIPLGSAWRQVFVADGWIEVVAHSSLVGLGVIGVLLADEHPWALSLLLLPVLATFAMLRHHVQLSMQVEAALHGVEANLIEAQRIARLGSLDWNLQTDDQVWSDETYRLLGYAPRSFSPTAEIFRSTVHPEDRARLDAAIHGALLRGAAYSLDHRVIQPDGTERTVHQQGEVVFDHAGRAARMVGTVHDVTERKALESRLAHRAFHDPLTELPNRALFAEHLERALQPSGGGREVAVLFLDLDGFKEVNDALGHEAGDRLLVAVADRLRQCALGGGMVARLGGDEFTLLVEAATDERELEALAANVVASLGQPFVLGERKVTVTASIGIARGTAGVTVADALLRAADAALYQAKAQGKNGYVIFAPRTDSGEQQRQRLRTELAGAVEREELLLHYQPVIDLRTGQIVAVEALARWHHPKHGLIPPDGFLPLAEEIGLVVPIGQWVLTEACRQAGAWRLLHPQLPPISVAVNIAPRYLREANLDEHVAAALRDAELPADALQLEITERVVLDDAALAGLRILRALGVRVVLDDFGTGISSLTQLRNLEIDGLKLDRAVIAGLVDPRTAGFVEGIVGLASNLAIPVTAEGIETSTMLAGAREIGCTHGQGFLIAPPLTSAAIGDVLADGGRYEVPLNLRTVAGGRMLRRVSDQA